MSDIFVAMGPISSVKRTLLDAASRSRDGWTVINYPKKGGRVHVRSGTGECTARNDENDDWWTNQSDPPGWAPCRHITIRLDFFFILILLWIYSPLRIDYLTAADAGAHPSGCPSVTINQKVPIDSSAAAPAAASNGMSPPPQVSMERFLHSLSPTNYKSISSRDSIGKNAQRHLHTSSVK